MVVKLDEQRLAQESPEDSQEVGNERGGGARTLSRLNFLRVAMLGGFAVLGWRLWDLQKPLRDSADTADANDKAKPETQFITTKAPRGIIYDRNNKRLVTNTATYSVTITANYLPDPSNARTKDEAAIISAQRQSVYDDLALFLGMNYFISVIPEQVNGARNKKNEFTNPDRNAIFNELEIITGVSAKDWDKTLTGLADQGKDKDLFIVNQKEPIAPAKFDHYKYLRTDKKFFGVYFQSEGELKMAQAQNFIPAYQPVMVWPQLSREDAMQLTEKRLDFPGVDIQISYTRQYENPYLYGHILGYTGHFSSQDSLDKANKEAQGDSNNLNDPNDPSNDIKLYEIDDKIGVTGIEGWMEGLLRGRKGANEVQVDSSGHILKTLRTGKAAQPGYSVALTIDNDLQAFATASLQKILDSKDPKITNKDAKVPEGAVVVLDVKTGEVLALVGLPAYDNNLYNKPVKEWTPKERADMNDEEKSLETNRATSARYAPGSTFKLVTAVAALNEKAIFPNSTFVCNHAITIPKTLAPINMSQAETFRCWGQHGPQNVIDAIQNSCDVFFYNAAVPSGSSSLSGANRYYNAGATITGPTIEFHGLGIDLLNGYMSLFNLGKKTGIELPGEYSGVLPGRQIKPQWSIGDTMTTSIGQGDLEVTPLQMCMITACFANNGLLLQPRLVREVRDGDGKVIVPFEKKLIRDVTKDPVKWPVPDPADPDKQRFISADFRLEPSVMQLVREGMLRVTDTPGGTAASQMYAKMGKLKVAGKTGTAEYGEPVSKNDKNEDVRNTRAWFTAYAPYDNPRYAVTALIASGGAGAEGSTFAVPIVKEILQKLFPEETKQPEQKA